MNRLDLGLGGGVSCSHWNSGLDTLSPASGTIWEGLGGVVLLEKVCH